MTKKSITLEVDPTIIENNMKIVQEDPMEGELNKLLSAVDPYPFKVVKPRPGLCVKTFTKPDNKKIFINVCLTEAIPCPRDISSEELTQILNSDDPSSYRVPMSIGEGRTESDKSGVAATVYDVAINPDFFAKIEKDDLFQTFFLTIVFEGLQDKYQIEIDMPKFIVMKNRKSIGTLQSHRIQIRDVRQYDSAPKPLIEEIKKPKSENPKEIAYRLRREPPTGEIDHFFAEFMIPATVELKDLNLEVGEDRLVLDTKGLFKSVDFYFPTSVDQDVIEAYLNRNNDRCCFAAILCWVQLRASTLSLSITVDKLTNHKLIIKLVTIAEVNNFFKNKYGKQIQEMVNQTRVSRHCGS